MAAAVPLNVAGLSLRLDAQTEILLDGLFVRPGMLVALTGPSGSGKSTLLYLLSGLLKAQSGQIRWGETDLTQLSEGRRDGWRLANAGFIFQDFHLFPELSPEDNALLPLWFSSFSARAGRQAARERLARLNVPTGRRRTALLSRGEMQRVALARALARDPAILFADEPTASLDTDAGKAVIALLSDLAHREGRTIIAATHDPALRAAADMLVHLDHGIARTEVSA